MNLLSDITRGLNAARLPGRSAAVFGLLLAACGIVRPVPTQTAIPSLTSIPAATSTPAFPDTWAEITPGLEIRRIGIDSSESGVALVRIDLGRHNLRVIYQPDSPLTVAKWQAQTGAEAVINAGFFQPDHTSAGLIISDGVSAGVSFDTISARYYEFGGMIGVSSNSVDIRALSRAPYDPAEHLDQAVQGLPMLIDQGVPVAFSLPERAALRTFVALDDQGRLILGVIPGKLMSLIGLRDWLASLADPRIVSALNLDGGPSTGMALETGGWSVTYDSVSEVPSVIAISGK
jgi:hypothetical protein